MMFKCLLEYDIVNGDLELFFRLIFVFVLINVLIIVWFFCLYVFVRGVWYLFFEFMVVFIFINVCVVIKCLL